MRVLFVCSGNSKRSAFEFQINQSFIYEEAEALSNHGVSYDVYLVRGRGIGYLLNLVPLIKKIRVYKPDIVHAQYGLSGLLAVMQRKVPVVITFQGSDVNIEKNRWLSFLASKMSTWNIFVSGRLKDKLKTKQNYSVIPRGVDMSTFYPRKRLQARRNHTLTSHKTLVLFSSRFDNKIKNYSLAAKAIELLRERVTVLELKDYSRCEVSRLLNAVDVLVMTSIWEGSPNIIKEAMACNCPIVSTDVGDVKSVIGDTEGCYITTYDPEDVAQKIIMAIDFGKRTNGRENIAHLEIGEVAKKIADTYQRILF